MKKSLSLFIICLASILNSYGLDSLKVQQLSGLCKAWGYLKYYHPKIQKGKIDWDASLIATIPKVINASNYVEYNKIINQFIFTVGQVENPGSPYKYFPKDTSCNNLDFSWINNEVLFTRENSQLLFEVIENYKPRKNVYNKREFNTRYEEKKFSHDYTEDTYIPDSSHALLALFRYWNAINYFYPYKKLMDENWNDILTDFIPKALDNANSGNFYIMMAELVTKINDCHGFYDNAYFNREIGPLKSLNDWRRSPVIVEFVENKTIITHVKEKVASETNLKRGDIILAINEIPIEQIRTELRKYCGCSTAASIEREINWGIFMSHFVPKEIEYSITVSDSNNEIKTISLNENFTKGEIASLGELDLETRLISDSIGYIDLSYMNMKEIRKSMKLFQNTHALIFDLRDNSNGPLLPIGMRLDKRKGGVFANYYKLNYKYPGFFKHSKIRDGYLGLRTFRKKYKGTVIILINENVQSTFEFMLMSLISDFEITLVGSNTSGTDGVAPSFRIQDNIITWFSGDAVLFPDGKQTQRVGIKPDVYAEPTINGIREGKDDVLEHAVEFIKGGSK